MIKQEKIFFILFLLGLINVLFLNQIAMAGGTTTARGTLSENDAIKNVVRNNYDLRSAKISIALAKADLLKAGLWPNPEGEFSIHSDKFFADEGEGGYAFGFNQSIPISGRISFQKRVASFGVQRAQYQLEDAKRRVIAQAKKIFYQIILLEEKEKALTFLVKTDQELLALLQARWGHAEVSQVDISLAHGDLLMVSQDLAEIEARLYESRADLNTLMGESIDNTLILGPESLVFPLITLDMAIKKSLEDRPDLKAGALEEMMGDGALTLAKVMRIPDITVGGFYQSDKSRFDVNNQPVSDNSRFLGIKISTPLPFFNHNQGEIARAAADKESMEVQYDALKAQITKEVAQAYVRVKTSRQIMDSYAYGIIEDMQKSVKLMKDAYLQGQVSVFDVIQTQSKLINIQKAYLDAHQNAREAVIDFESALGGDNP